MVKIKNQKTGSQFVCPSCGGSHTIRHGFNVTKRGKFARRKCQQCGTTFYENKGVRE